MTGRSSDTTVHEEVDAAPDSVVKNEGRSLTDSQPNEVLQPNALAVPGPTTYEATKVWKLILSDDFTLNAEYLLDGSAISTQKMVHVIWAYRRSRKGNLVSDDLTDAQQSRVVSAICEELDSSGFLQENELPGITFVNSAINIFGPNQDVLVESHKVLSNLNTLGGIDVRFVSKGIPFKARLWGLRGLIIDPDLAKLAAAIKEYVSQNVECLGKPRAIWAQCFDISGINGKLMFCGNVMLLTDRDTIVDDRTPPPFQEVEPRIATWPF